MTTTDRSLAVLLRSLQSPTDLVDATRFLPSATALLTVLTNPLNVTLLSSQLILAPSLWDQLDLHSLHTCLRVFTVFNSASITVAKNLNPPPVPPSLRDFTPITPGLDLQTWLKAVVRGADDRSPRWRHLLIIGGCLFGFEGQGRHVLPGNLRRDLSTAFVKATSLALEEALSGSELAGQCITLVLNYTYDLLSDQEKRRLSSERILAVLMHATFFSVGGLKAGFFVGCIDADIIQTSSSKFGWSQKSNSFSQIRDVMSSPIIGSLGPISRLISQVIAVAQDDLLLQNVAKDIYEFSRTILVQWRQNKFSEIDASEESTFLDEETLTKTLPVLWQLLKASMFSSIVVLHAITSKVLSDTFFSYPENATLLATHVLHALRHLYFISSRSGNNSFSQYTFVYMTAIDILGHDADQSREFLEGIRPAQVGTIPSHPLDRCLDLYFLNTAEHFPLVLSSKANEDLLISAAVPYLAAGGDNHILSNFEAGHSVILAVLSSSQGAELAPKYVPFYIETLFKVFPKNLSARQFRFAFKTLLTIAAPPSSLAKTQPLLPSILLQLVHERAVHASTAPLPLPSDVSQTSKGQDANAGISEQAVLILTIIDGLPFLPLNTLEEWLSITANLINSVADDGMKIACRTRFWEVISGGTMDVERSVLCVTWWNTRGGREMLLYPEEEDLKIQSKL